jgi:hypothetical protein
VRAQEPVRAKKSFTGQHFECWLDVCTKNADPGWTGPTAGN